MNEEIFEVIDRNKAKAYEEKKQKEKQERGKSNVNIWKE